MTQRQQVPDPDHDRSGDGPDVDHLSRLSAVRGGLLGVAVGDALGATVEFMRPAAIAAQFGVHRDIIGGGAFGWRAGQGTDDTDLTAAVLRAYLGVGGYTLESVAGHMLGWFDVGPRDVGGTTADALRRLRRTHDPRTSGATADRSAGNGSLMRALPTGLARANVALRRVEAAEISRITHAEARCVDACVAYCDLAAWLLDGIAPTQAIDRVLAETPIAESTRHAIAAAPSLTLGALDTSGYVLASLQVAVWAIVQHTGFEETLVAIVNRGGDADTTGAIAGGLLGVRDGVDAIPPRWLAALEYRDEFWDAATVLART